MKVEKRISIAISDDFSTRSSGEFSSDFVSRAVSLSWGWRSILMLQFEMQFSVAIALSIVISFVIVISEFAYALGTHHPASVNIDYNYLSIYILYAFDVMYFIDLLLMTIYKNVSWSEISWKYAPRGHTMLIIEYASLIPIDGMYYAFSQAELVLLYLLRLRYAVRIFRLFLYYRGQNYASLKSYIVHITLVIVITIVKTAAATALCYVHICYGRNCTYRDTDLFKKVSYTFLSKITEIGGLYESLEDVDTGLLSVLAACVFLFNMYLISNFICDIVILTEEKFSLAHSFQILQKKMSRAKFDRKTDNPGKYIQMMQTAFNLFWQKKKGIIPKSVLNNRYLPAIKSKEIALDMSWMALKHSHYFRSQQTEFLRYISIMVQHTYMTPGELIYQKGEPKSKFVYVVSGVVQILSEVDNETAVMSLSDGTCFGETCLYIDYKSTCSVTCKEYCELAILEKKDLIQISKLYPKEARQLLNFTLKRYKYARCFASIANFQIQQRAKLEEMHIKWLKYILRKLLFNEVNESRHVVQILEASVFCTKYLDMLAIAQEIKLVTDTVFLKKTFPWIFQPSSSVLTGWNRFVIIVFLVHSVVYTYNVSVAPKITHLYVVYHVLLSIVWLCDLLLEMSTAVKTTQNFYVTIPDIVSYKSQHITFVFNIISALSPGLLLKFVMPNASSKHILLYECNKLFKVYKIEQYFDSIKFTNMTRMVVLIYLKFAIYMLLITLYLAGFLVLTICFDWKCVPDFEEYMIRRDLFHPLGVLRYGILHTINFFCSFQCVFDAFHTYDELLAMQSVLFIFHVIFTAYRVAAEAVRLYDVHYISDYAKRTKNSMACFTNDKMFYTDAYWNIMIQYKFDGINFLYGKVMRTVLPRNLTTIIRQITFKEDTMKFPIFAETYKCVIEEVTKLIQSILLPKCTLVVSEGESCRKMYLIQLGNCVIWSHNTKPRILGPGDSFCVFETCLEIPSFNTVETVTTCLLIVLGQSDYQRIVLKQRHVDDSYELVKHEFKTILDTMPSPRNDPYVPWKRRKSKTLIQRMGVKKSTIKKADLPRWGRGLRFVLMPLTFQRHGHFMRGWEMCRWFLAFGSAILATSFRVSCSATPEWSILLLILDFTAWIDIYLRHHIIYNSFYRSEVRHPYLTAVNYWKHAFCLDLLACIPFDIFYYVISGGNTIVPFYYRLNRLLQLYRINGIVKYYSFINLMHIKIVELLKYATLAIVAISFFTAIHFDMVCDLQTNCTAHCMSSLLSFDSSVNITMTEKYHTIIVLFNSAVFLNNYFEFPSLAVRSEEAMLMIAGVLGYMYWSLVSSKVIAANLTRDFLLISYQNAMKDLVKFMNIRRLDKRLKNEIIGHFEYMWLKKQGVRLQALLRTFPDPTRKVILFNVCGSKMMESGIFDGANESIIRNLLLISTHVVILKSGIIYRVNDVIGILFFLLKGNVEVIGPDGNHMQILPEGSLFGNLDNIANSRQTLTMTAYGHVELLRFNTLEFYEVLLRYKSYYKKFLRLTAMNVDFIENTADQSKTTKKKTAVRKKGISKISDNQTWMKIWRKFMVIVALLSFMFETYHVCTLHHDALLILMLYVFDILYVIRIILKFNTAYNDEFGNLIRNKSLIASRYKRTSLFYDLCSTLPFEALAIIALAFGFEAFGTWWSYLRLNRVLRIGYSLYRARSMIDKLNVNAFWVRSLYCTLLLLTSLTSLVALLCYFDSYGLDTYNMTPREKFENYIHFWKIMLQMILKTTILYDLSRLQISVSHILILCMMVSKWMIMTYVSQVVCTIQIINNRRNIFETFSTRIKSYMELNYVSPPLQNANNEYLYSLWRNYDGVQLPRLLEEAPYYLKEGVLNSLFGIHLRKHSIFKKCHVDLIRQVSACFKVMRVYPRDIITYVGDIDHSMYFIHSGAVELLSEDSLYQEDVDGVLHEGEMFGFDQGIYMRLGHEYTYKACKTSLILALKREDWIHLLDFYPASKLYLYDKMKEI